MLENTIVGTALLKVVSEELVDLRRKLSLTETPNPHALALVSFCDIRQVCCLVALWRNAARLVQYFAPTCAFAAGMSDAATKNGAQSVIVKTASTTRPVGASDVRHVAV